jgi:hypothetical protein
MPSHKRDSASPSKEADDFEGVWWEYRARNLKKVAGIAMERDFNEHGAAGWEFCAPTDTPSSRGRGLHGRCRDLLACLAHTPTSRPVLAGAGLGAHVVVL